MFHKGAVIPGDFPNLAGEGEEARSLKIASLDELAAILVAWCEMKAGG